ncbi:MAG: hypothetical protein AAFV53_34290 [Myxococcota bacterium]
MTDEELAFLDEILAPFRQTIGRDVDGYRNHCARMLHFHFALGPATPDQRRMSIIAAAFHDIGIWTDNTVDYIEPSIPPAQRYLSENQLDDWIEVVSLLISEHHKIRPYTDPRYPLVEQFRKADLVDFSLGTIRSGLSVELVRDVRARFPNAGFHAGLVQKASAWFLRNPLNPAPMMKW